MVDLHPTVYTVGMQNCQDWLYAGTGNFDWRGAAAPAVYGQRELSEGDRPSFRGGGSFWQTNKTCVLGIGARLLVVKGRSILGLTLLKSP